MTRIGRIILSMQILSTTLLMACTARTPFTVCHATGEQMNPYDDIAVTSAELNDHRNHPNDINPAPASGCPLSLVTVSNGEIIICHATGSKTNPFVEIKVSANGLNGYGNHEGDFIPVLKNSCQTSPSLFHDEMIQVLPIGSCKEN